MAVVTGKEIDRFKVEDKQGLFLARNMKWVDFERASVFSESHMSKLKYPKESVYLAWIDRKGKIIGRSKIVHD